MSLPIRQNNLSDPREKERILAQYAGIFPNNIQEFAQTMAVRKNKPRKNFAR